MKIFTLWAISGIIPIMFYILYEYNPVFFDHASFIFILTMWMLMGTFALIDLIKFVKSGVEE